MHGQHAKADRLSAWLEEVRAAPEVWDDWLADELADRLAIAERFEAACAEAIEVSGIAVAKLDCQDRAQDLHEIMLDVRSTGHRTITVVRRQPGARPRTRHRCASHSRYRGVAS